MKRFAYLALLLLVAGCGQPRLETASTADDDTTTVAFNLAGAPTVEFSMPDMMCPEGCGAKTKEILSEQPGAKEVVIDFEAKLAIVAVEEELFDAEAAIEALVDHGFENSSLHSADDEAKTTSQTDKRLAD